MRTMKRTFGLVLAGLAAAAALAQNPAGQAPPPGARGVPNEGFWPTQRMMDLAIDRLTDEMAKQYSFDDDQVLNTRDLFKQRFPGWLQANRPELQTLMNQYFEAIMAGEPPSPEQVAEWAQRAMPLFQQFTELVDQTTNDMRSYMTDDQQVLLDGQLAAMKVGMNYMQQRLQTWEQGGYDADTEFPGSENAKKQEKIRQQQLAYEAENAKRVAMGLPPLPENAAAGGGAPGVQPAKPDKPVAARSDGSKDDWAAYVENFIKRYKLDEAQQNSDRRFLTGAQAQRDKHVQRHSAEILSLDERAKAAKTDAEREKLRDESDRLNKPIERTFTWLKEKLDRLPTRSQHAAAAQEEMAARAKAANPGKAEKAAKGETPAPPAPAEAPKENKPSGG